MNDHLCDKCENCKKTIYEDTDLTNHVICLKWHEVGRVFQCNSKVKMCDFFTEEISND